MSVWIKCSDRLPEEAVMVIGSGRRYPSYTASRWVEMVFYCDGGFHPPILDEDSGDLRPDFDSTMNETTHWMPLPTPPTE